LRFAINRKESDVKTIPLARNYGSPSNYVFDARTPPVLRVASGEEFCTELQDAFNGVLREDPAKRQPQDLEPYTDRIPFWYNPVCGPVYVEGAQRGDVLAVTIGGIDELTDGSVTTVPRAHHFAGMRGWEETDESYTGIIRHRAGVAEFTYGSRTHRWRLQPFVGTIATAPDYESLSTLPTNYGSVMACGGNLDCCDIRPGATVYLQSMNDGGLLFVGDLHASQGDGEICGVADEVSGRLRLTCRVVKRQWLRNVRVETPEALVSLYCYRPMEEGFRQAVRDLILWLEQDYGFTRREAYLLASACPDFRLRAYQMCAGIGRVMTTVGAEFPRYLLPARE